MKRPFFAAVLLIGLLLAGQAIAQRGMHWRGSGGWSADGPYNQLYDVSSVVTLSGEIESISEFVPGKRMTNGVHLRLRTEQETLDVHLGPLWFIENQDVTLAAKEQIEVTGSRVTYEGAPALLAAEVRKGEELLVLRSERGHPVWSGWRPTASGSRDCLCCGRHLGSAFTPAPGDEAVVGTVVSLDRNAGEQGQCLHLVLKTETGELPVHLGPARYLEPNNFNIASGARLEVSGFRIIEAGKPAFRASQVKMAGKLLNVYHSGCDGGCRHHGRRHH